MEHIIELMSCNFKHHYFDMFDLMVMSDQIKKILVGQVCI